MSIGSLLVCYVSIFLRWGFEIVLFRKGKYNNVFKPIMHTLIVLIHITRTSEERLRRHPE